MSPQSGSHRDIHTPWRVTFTCWYSGHAWEPLTHAYDHCTRCGRTIPIPPEKR